MKATLEFELPEESEEHQIACCAIDYRSALIEFQKDLNRAVLAAPKVATDPQEQARIRTVQSVSKRFNEILFKYAIRLPAA